MSLVRLRAIWITNHRPSVLTLLVGSSDL